MEGLNVAFTGSIPFVSYLSTPPIIIWPPFLARQTDNTLYSFVYILWVILCPKNVRSLQLGDNPQIPFTFY